MSFGALLGSLLFTGHTRQQLAANESQISMAAQYTQPLNAQPFMKPPSVRMPLQHRVAASRGKGKWKGLDEDISDDQEDITRGRGMVDPLFQGQQGVGGTHNAIMSSAPASHRRSFADTDNEM